MSIKNLNKLLKEINPVIVGEDFVFCTVNETIEMGIVPKMIFREKEGTTLIIRKNQAEQYGLSFNGIWTMITLSVNSDLQAVGFLAKITDALAKANICVNAVSAFYHDHLFVPKEKSKEAIGILKNLSRKS